MIVRLRRGWTRQSRSCPPTVPARWPPSAQSPFARSRCYLLRRGISCAARGRYPSFIAPTGSCASPKPSADFGLLIQRSLQVAVSPCWERDFPDVISAIFAHVLGPLLRHTPRLPLSVASPRTPVSPHGKRVRRAALPHTATSVGSRISRLQSFVYLRAPTLARPPGCSDRGAQRRRAARPFTPRRTRPVTRSGQWRRFVSDTDN